MSEEQEADEPVRSSPHELAQRYGNIKRIINENKSIITSEEERDIRFLQSNLDELSDIFRECQHPSRGIIVTKDGILWTIKHMDDCLRSMESWGLTSTDEYIDLRSDRSLLVLQLSEFPDPGPDTSPPPPDAEPEIEHQPTTRFRSGDIVVVEQTDDGCSYVRNTHYRWSTRLKPMTVPLPSPPR